MSKRSHASAAFAIAGIATMRDARFKPLSRPVVSTHGGSTATASSCARPSERRNQLGSGVRSSGAGAACIALLRDAVRELLENDADCFVRLFVADLLLLDA